MPNGAARNAVDCALWDLESKISGKRIWELTELIKYLFKGHLSEPAIVTTVYSLGVDTPKKMGKLAKKNSSSLATSKPSCGRPCWPVSTPRGCTSADFFVV